MMRESARSKIRVIVKRVLGHYGYPPDLQDEAVQSVLLQAETLCKGWVA
jgi:type I restriction enzyme R subunit